MYEVNVSEEEVFEKISIMPVFWLAGFYTLIIYLITFYPVYFSPKLYFFHFLSYNLSALLFYGLVYFILFVVLTFMYRSKAVHMRFFSDVKLLGFYPVQIISRTSLTKEDIWGATLSIVFAVLTIIFPKIFFLLPLFLLLAFLFIFATLSDKGEPWELRYKEE